MSTPLREALDDLRHHLKVKFRLPPHRPTDEELTAILGDIAAIPRSQRTEDQWRRIVHEHVKFDGMYVYEGLDLSDLNQLQAQVMALLNG